MESSSIFKPYQDYHNVRGDKQIMIKNSIGRQLPYIVNFQKNTCQIFDIELERVTHAFAFPDSCQLIDADYFPTADGEFGIIIGVEDTEKTWGSTNFVLGLTTEKHSPTMRVTHSLGLPERITVVKTLYSNDNMMDSKNLGLFPKLLTWPHIVAIGCKNCKCFLTQLSAVNGSSDVPIIHVAKRSPLDLLASFVENDLFIYTLEDSAYREYPRSGVYVSSLALMPRSRTLLVGLSMGGIIAASLNSSNQMAMLELRHERVVQAMAPLEPEDDPDKFEYFIAAVDRSPRHPIMLQLWRGAFPKDQCPDDQKYDRPSYSVCLEHKIMHGERWLSVKTIVQERSMDSGLRRRNDSSMDSTLLNSSQLFGCTFNRSNVFLAYSRQGAVMNSFEVEAAMFDIDAWYYKRVPGRVLTDGTALRQCPFMSCVKSEIDPNQVTDIGILTSDSTNMYRFNSMVSDADQLFYPSAVSYERVFVAFQTNISWMKIQNVQETILQKCASRLPWIVRTPDHMATNIIAAGLVRKNILTGSPNASVTEELDKESQEKLSASLRVVLNSMIYYGKIEEFCALITRNDLSDKIKVEIAEWAFLEAIDFKRIVADRIVALFQGSTAALSPLAENTLHQGIKMFRIVHEYLRGCSKCVTEGGAALKNYTSSAKCMLNHTKLVHQFINSRIVPVNHSIELLMRQQHERRKNTALKNRTALPIQVTTRNMHRLASNAQFWNQMPHDEWYPPTPLDLLESVLNVSITERLKRDLIVQYILDWFRANPENTEYTDSQLAMEVIKTMSMQMLDVDLEKIYYILEQEKAALTTPTTVVPVEEASTSKKVFSLEKDGLTYEQLWSDKIHLGWTIKPADLERFKQRMKAQEEDVEGTNKKKLFDPETEMFYQAFLCENQKYHLMSTEAIASNKLLLSFYPNILADRGRHLQKSAQKKSAKEREVEKLVKEMFEKQNKRDMEEMPEVYAKMGEQEGVAGGGGGRKRKSEVFENREDVSPMSFMPPTAKRIQRRGATPTSADEPTIELDENQQKKNVELNNLIATPARYYKRPAPVDLSSPTHIQKAPPVHHTNSILKTAKTIQSPGRGRIRFHASVRKGANESADEALDEENEAPEDAAAAPKINFAILEDEEEEPTYRRSSRDNSKTFEAQTPIPEGKTPEFEVLEDKVDEIEETTFEIQDDDDANFKSLEENATYEEPEEKVNVLEGIHEESQKTEEIQMEIESVSDETEAPEEAITTNTEATEDYQEPEWDGIERSFEKQKDEDCDPTVCEDPVFLAPKNPAPSETKTSEPVEADDGSEDVDSTEDLARDIPLDRTFEVQEEDEEPKPRGDTPVEEPSETLLVEKPKIVKQKGRKTPPPVQTEQILEEEIARPPSANTRSSSRTTSRPPTPVEEPAPKPPKVTAKKTQIIEKSTEIQEEDVKSTMKKAAPKNITPEVAEDVSEAKKVEEKRPPSRTRRAVQKPSDSVEIDAPEVPEEEEPPKRPASRTRAARAKASEVVTEETAPERSSSRARSTRATSKAPEDPEATINKKTPESTIPEEKEEEVVRPASRNRRVVAAKKEGKPEPSTPTRSRSRSRTISEVVVPIQASEDVAKPTPRGRGRASRATTPSRNDTDLANTTITTKATKGGRKAASERPVTPTNEVDDDLNTTGASIQRRLCTRSVTRAASVQPESSTPAPVATSTQRPTRGTVVNSAPTTPRRGRKPKAASESEVTVVVPSSGARATKRRNTPEEPDTPHGAATSSEPAKKSAKSTQSSRSRTTPLKSIPEAETPKTPKRGRSRTNSASSNSATPSVPNTPKRGRKAAVSALEVLEEEIQEEEPPQPEVRRSARRLQQQQPPK
ncbi:hypothetical protein CAEBREN_13903 [Caenorhabditis brenneri]|uniref:Uncharacterized protein n=1 Tax=Caenorhabditis brenneri TaxID=135651 RepID=G0MBS8_CAEBE|nr:hypothetical protein CAEBREN_13903 [Caenorhabditis brenneri]